MVLGTKDKNLNETVLPFWGLQSKKEDISSHCLCFGKVAEVNKKAWWETHLQGGHLLSLDLSSKASQRGSFKDVDNDTLEWASED